MAPLSEPGSRWSVLGIAGVAGLCCIGVTSLLGGAALVGGTAAGVTAAGGTVTTVAGAAVVALATALPLVVLGLAIRWRANTS